jgi:preprotein translocase subunit SecD
MRRVAAGLLALALTSLGVAGCGSDGEGDKPAVLQLRPVLGGAGDCKVLASNPPEKEPVSLELQGRCVGLGPSVLSIDSAEVVAERRDTFVVAQLKLSEDDTETLADVSADFLGKEVGIVAFGRLLVAPVFNEPILEGRVEVLGLSASEVEDLRRALAD